MSSNHNKPQLPKALMKQHSLPRDVNRDEPWLRMKKRRPSDCLRRSKSCVVTNDDIEELKACFDLGFGFEPDSPDFNPRLSKTIPALDLYSVVHRQFINHLSRTSSSTSEHDLSNSSTTTIVNKGDDGKTRKKKLKQWAKVVACSARQSSGKTKLMK